MPSDEALASWASTNARWLACVCDSCAAKLIPSALGEIAFRCVLPVEGYPEMQVHHDAKLTREGLIRISKGEGSFQMARASRFLPLDNSRTRIPSKTAGKPQTQSLKTMGC
jgi:hypothetical protein